MKGVFFFYTFPSYLDLCSSLYRQQPKFYTLYLSQVKKVKNLTWLHTQDELCCTCKLSFNHQLFTYLEVTWCLIATL